MNLASENLGKKFGSFHAVKDFSFTFTENRSVASCSIQLCGYSVHHKRGCKQRAV